MPFPIQHSYRCPRCSKSFLKPSSVNRHLRQPRSTCARLHTANGKLVQLRLRSEEVALAEEGMEIDEEHLEGLDNEIFMGNHPHDFVERLGDDSNDDVQLQDLHRNPNQSREPFKHIYATAGATLGKGQTFIDIFDLDGFREERTSNLYYPFLSRKEWGLGSWLLQSGLSLAQINEFLSLEIMQDASLSFSNAKALRGRAELLPSGPKWICKPLVTENPTKAPVLLYYRDAVGCLQLLMQNPLHASVMEFKPYQLYEDVEKSVRLYTEWLSGTIAWQMQDNIPKGATLLGAVLSSDKTTISIMTGNHTAYPLLISLANIKMDYRLKNSHDTFILLALLPVAKFIHSNRRMRGLLHDRLTHACLDIILQPLKVAAYQGVMMSDPLGFQRLCYITLASYTVDTPEAQLLACVGAKSSPVTTAYYKQFGDPVRSATRTATVTLTQMNTVKAKLTSTSTLADILKEARAFRLNGVLDPFWQNWNMADPSVFLTPEPLHHWHKQFWDHDLKWCIAIVGAGLIDFLFAVLQPRVGFRQFKDGISSLKQVTGRDHREIQRYIIPAIASIAPRDVVLAVRSLMDVRYMGQCPTVDSCTCHRILSALNSFHEHKNSIIEAGGRVGKGGVRMNHFNITKVELYHNVVPSIIANGSASQWTADITEHAHHTDIKVPARAGNNQNYDSQILRSLDRMDKCRCFDLATSIKDAGVSFRSWIDIDQDNDVDEELILEDSEGLTSHITPVSKKVFGTVRTIVDYFDAAERLVQGTHNYLTPPPRPFRIFSSGSVAFHLARDPSMKTMTIDEAAQIFSIPDLRSALQEFILHINDHGDIPCKIGGRRATIDSALSFKDIQVWTRIRVQYRSYHHPHQILPAVTLNCLPPTGKWLHGLYDNVLVNTDGHYRWPESQFKGHCVAQLRLIFRAVPPKGSVFPPGLDGFLTYVQRFNLINQGGRGADCPDPTTGMFVLRRSVRADGSRQGGIIQVKHIRRDLYLMPRFRSPVDSRLSPENCMEYYSEFWLNDYFDKETYYSFRLSKAD